MGSCDLVYCWSTEGFDTADLKEAKGVAGRAFIGSEPASALLVCADAMIS